MKDKDNIPKKNKKNKTKGGIRKDEADGIRRNT